MKRINRSLKTGIDAIEIDLRLTKDQQLIVHHGPKIKANNQTAVRIKDKTLKDLKTIAPNLLTLEQAANLVLKESSLELVLDCKGRGWSKSLVRYLEGWNQSGYDTNRIIALSFYGWDLYKLKKAYPASRTYFLFRYMLFFHLMVCRLIRAEGSGYNWLFTWRPLVWFSHQHNLKLYYYTVNNLGQAAKYSKHRVDYLCTDYPETIGKRLRR
ncbi:glycerophosphodiester phosphodiesterase [Candidatus Saccharibacteria bacterium]|nr:glycerophosphodiester phosphodiesterase [Candidatus Saccharibacteria bacterium]